MARQYTWERLPQVIKDMDPDEREEYLAEKGILLVPSGVAPPPNAIIESAKRERNIDTSGTDVMGFGPGLTHPENREAMAKAAIGAGSTALGGGGLIAAGLMGGLNAAMGPDPFSGRGVAEAVGNVAFGRMAPFMNAGVLGKGGQFVQGIKNGLLGAGQVGATQALGDKLTQNPMPASESLGPMGMLGAGAASAILPAAAARFLKSVEKSTPMVRNKMQPIVDRLTKKPQAVETLPAGPDIPTAPATFDDKVKKLVQYVEDSDPERYGKTDAILAQPSQNDDLAAQMRATLIARGIPEEEIDRKLAAMGGTAPTPRPSPPAAPIPTAGAPPTPAAPLAISDIDAMAARNPNATAFKRLGGKTPTEYIEETVSGKNWGSIPEVIREMDAAFPDGQFRNAVREKITEKVLSGVGEAGAFGDLSPLQRIQAFGKQKFGEKTGAQVINQIFDSPEAYRNLSDLQDIIDASGRGGDKPGWWNHAKVFVNKFSPVIGGTAFGVTMYVPMLQNPAVATGGLALGTVKAFTLGSDALAEYLGKKNTKWADVLYDLATGGNRYSAQSVSNVISGLRRRAEDERDLSADEAAAEYQQRMQQ